MKYYVKYRIEATYTAEVEADSLKKAKEKANVDFHNANFGNAKNVEAYPVTIKDETGRMYY